jgi:hypothetical protein
MLLNSVLSMFKFTVGGSEENNWVREGGSGRRLVKTA